jgi:hypothetical protein
MKTLRSDPEEITRTLGVLFAPNDVIELRIPKTERDGTVSGYFTDHAALAKQLAARNGDTAVYMTLNPVVPSLLARCANRVRSRARVTTADKDIQARRWLLVDCDPVRPAEISASDPEHAAALERAREIRMVLREEGWPAPVLADSGNGAHLLYRVELPNDEASTKLLEAVLKALAARFNDATVTVDEAVFNAARVCKAYGTVARKGDDVSERPHRLSRILEAPPTLELVSPALLRELLPAVAPPSKPRPAPSRSRFNIEAFLSQHLRARAPVDHEGGRKWVLEECPFNSDHKAPDAAVFERADGTLGFKCFHDSCHGKTWKDVRARFEPARPSERSPRSSLPPAPYAAQVDTGALSLTVHSLNVLTLFRGRLEFSWLRRRGTLVQAGFADGGTATWRTAGDLSTFGRSQTAIFEGTGVLLPTPAGRKIRSTWEPVAQLIRRIADQDVVETRPALEEEVEEILRDVWEQAGRPIPADAEKPDARLTAILRACHWHKRDPRAENPPECCIWTAEGACWIHSRSLLDWLSTPAGKNRHFPWSDMREALLLLGFRPVLLHRGTATVRVWRGPLDVVTDNLTDADADATSTCNTS